MKHGIRTTAAVFMLCTVLYASPVDLMIGARAYGFGGAYVAIADDPSAAYWNPACLSRIESVQLEESNWIFQDVEGLNVNYVGVAVPVKYVGTIGGSWLLQHAKLESGWDFASGKPAETGSANEHRFSLSAGRRLWDKLLIFENTAVGFSLNRHTYTTEDERSGAGLGFDIGIYTAFRPGIHFGLCARTLGTDMMGEKIDPEIRAGLGYSTLINDMHRLTAAVDAEYKRNRDYKSTADLDPAEHNVKAFGGLEYALVLNDWEIALRGGANSSLYTTLHSYGVAGGLGFKFKGYALHYAFRGDTDPDVTLGFQHRISLIIDFSNLGFGRGPKFTGEYKNTPEKDAGTETEPEEPPEEELEF